MSSEGTSRGVEAVEDDFEAIEKAVMESRRGRWFLEEYARRRSGSETKTLLAAIGKLENAVAANHNLVAERLDKALGLIRTATTTAAAPVELAPHHMKFFKQDEELFEAPIKPAITDAAAAKPSNAPISSSDVIKGAKLIIRPLESRVQGQTAALEPPMDFPQLVQLQTVEAQIPAVAAPPKNRIVIIRHKAGEAINVPLHDEMRASA